MLKPKPTPRRWFILIQERAPCHGDPRKWWSWRKFSAWPITFKTQREGVEFMKANFTFKNLKGLKMSASVVDRMPGAK